MEEKDSKGKAKADKERDKDKRSRNRDEEERDNKVEQGRVPKPIERPGYRERVPNQVAGLVALLVGLFVVVGILVTAVMFLAFQRPPEKTVESQSPASQRMEQGRVVQPPSVMPGAAPPGKGAAPGIQPGANAPLGPAYSDGKTRVSGDGTNNSPSVTAPRSIKRQTAVKRPPSASRKSELSNRARTTRTVKGANSGAGSSDPFARLQQQKD
jgi:hypothetical protein